ncbi:polyketide synthase [Novipirellula caenicola]|uniref:Polyketide synthase n=1 Tax=Novipirellula caenicola TaxID=1536901 RepID=A0ABP9VPN3_9BACT
MGTQLSLDPKLRQLIDSLRQRIRRYVVIDSLLAIVSVVLAAFWIGLALDYGPVLMGGTEMPPLARLILLIVVAVIVVLIVGRLLIGRLRRPLPDDSLALLLERQHPHLGGRLVTTIQLNQSGRVYDSHAEELLKQVHLQATQAVDNVDTSRVFSWQPIVRKSMIVAPLLLASLILLIFSPAAFGRAAGRLTLLSNDPWPRRAKLEMVGVELPVITATDEEALAPELVEFEDHVIRLPRGSSGTLRIRAKADDAEVPVVCTVYYRSDDGTRGQSNMRRIGRVVDGYQSFVLDGPPLEGLSDSISLSVRGLDARLDDFRIEAVTPPAITKMNVSVRYPEYLRPDGASEFDLQTNYQAGLRLREGSDVVLTATSSVPLGDTDVVLRNDAGEFERVELIPSEDRRQGQIVLDNFTASTAVRIVPRDQQGISAQSPYRYFFGVVTDEAPEVQMRLKGIGTAVTAIAKIPLEVVAKDDYGIESLTVSVTQSDDQEQAGTPDANGANQEKAPSDSAADDANGVDLPLKWDRDGNANTEIDLRDLVAEQRLAALVPGGVIHVLAEARDAYDLGQSHLTRSELYRLEIVTPEKLLALLERRELGLRTRLEQTIDETRNLRDTLDLLRRKGFDSATDEPSEEEDATRTAQVRLLRVQQTGLQTSKTTEELTGIAASLDDLLQEMINNRVDSADRRERIGVGVRDPLKSIVSGPLQRLKEQIQAIERSVENPEEASAKTKEAVQTAEDVLLQLTAVLEKMLDLESYNEILDMVRELIDDQNELLDETKAEQKKRVLDLFK